MVAIPWSAIRLAWECHWVSERSLAADLGIDRGNLRERALRENWIADDCLTLTQMENKAVAAEREGNISRAELIRGNLKLRSGYYALARDLLRAALSDARMASD